DGGLRGRLALGERGQLVDGAAGDGEAERDPGGVVRHHRRRAVERATVVASGAERLGERQGATGGDEDILGDDVVGVGAAHAPDVPGVYDLAFAGGEHDADDARGALD